MTSWGGTSMVTVLRSILTMLSTSGKSRKSPGPFGPPWTLPSLKMTPRSYSLTTLMALTMTDRTKIATITTIATSPIPTACNKPKVTYIKDPPLSARPVEISAATGQFDGHHLHHPSLAETHNTHLVPRPYDGFALLRIGLLWD